MERRIRRGIGYLTLMTQIGAIMVVSVSLGIYLGRLIDLYLGTQILFTMILLVAGRGRGDCLGVQAGPRIGEAGLRMLVESCKQGRWAAIAAVFFVEVGSWSPAGKIHAGGSWGRRE